MPDIIIQAFQEAVKLILSGNAEFYATVGRTVYASGLGTLLSCLWSIPIAVGIGLYSFRGKWVIRGIFNALIGVPTVALGLFLALVFSHSGELGFLHLLYTLNGLTVGDAILVTPIVVSFTASALSTADTQIRDLSKTLGASGLRTNLTIMRETVWNIVLAITASFNRCAGELGIATLVGGSLLGNGTVFGGTRVLTTGIAVETNFGNFDVALAYAIVLMITVMAIALIISLVERLRQEEKPFKTWHIFARSGG